mgnify:CR=1 FL=1
MIETLQDWFHRYVAQFRSDDGTLSPMQQLKVEHSLRVRECGLRIAEDLGWSRERALRAECAALLHDVGRFPQYAEYGTYQDRVSLNHGKKGAEVLRAWQSAPGGCELPIGPILTAVEFHNLPHVPGGLDPEDEALLRLVRDADKLDIFEVAYDGATHPDSLYTELTTWLSMDGPISEPVLECARNRQPIAYADLQSLGDMLLAQLCWVYDLNYPPSFTIMKQRNTFQRLRALIPVENGDAGSVLDQAYAHLQERA